MILECNECAALLELYRATIRQLRITVDASGSMDEFTEAWAAYEEALQHCEDLRNTLDEHAEAHGYSFLAPSPS